MIKIRPNPVLALIYLFLAATIAAIVMNTMDNSDKNKTGITTDEAVSTLYLGRDGEWWDAVMIWSLGFVAVAGVFVLLSTTGSINAHKREAKAAEEALTKFKLETGDKISNANARAVEAQLALEEYKAPRFLKSEKIPDAIEVLKTFSGRTVSIYTIGEGLELNNFALEIKNLLGAASIESGIWTWIGGGKGTGVHVLQNPISIPETENFSRALSKALSIVGVDAGRAVWNTDWQTVGGFLFGSEAERAKDAPIRIIIGAKN